MIIGDGDIASVLKDRDDLIYFASGVSNSLETRQTEFRREKDLLFDQYDEGKHLVYFSSLSIFYKDSPYTKHKKRMEQFVKMISPSYTIVRLGNITWGTNPHTLINHFKAQKARGQPIDIQDTYRYIVDKDEFLYWLEMAPNWSCEMNITGKRLKVKEIIEQYVENI